VRATWFAVPICLVCIACGGTGGPEIVAQGTPDTVRTVTGQVSYWVTGPLLANRDADGRLASSDFFESQLPLPVPRVIVEVRDSDGRMLVDVDGRDAIRQTGEFGEFELIVNFGQRPATQIILTTRAEVHLPFGTVIRVLRDEFATESYSYTGSPSGDPSDATKAMRVNLEVPKDGAPGAWKICDVLYEGFIAAKSGILGATMPDLDVHYKAGNGDISEFTSFGARAILKVAGGITGDPTSNRDVWDDPKLMRLHGEYLLHYFFLTVPPEGEPNDQLMVPSLAWREGFLDFWACMGRGVRTYWDTEGIGADGRVIRYFDIESFFSETLGSLGPDDPNVYQPDDVVGIGSRFSVAEVLWDIHDGGFKDDDPMAAFPLALSLQFLRQPSAGIGYPYLLTLLDAYVRDQSIHHVALHTLMQTPPDDQEIPYPATEENDSLWPPPFPHPTITGAGIAAPYDTVLSDAIDTTAQDINLDVSFHAQRYFKVQLVRAADFSIFIESTTVDLEVDLLDLRNNVLASGVAAQPLTGEPALTVQDVEGGGYVIRVRAVSFGQNGTYDLRLVLSDD